MRAVLVSARTLRVLAECDVPIAYPWDCCAACGYLFLSPPKTGPEEHRSRVDRRRWCAQPYLRLLVSQFKERVLCGGYPWAVLENLTRR